MARTLTSLVTICLSYKYTTHYIDKVIILKFYDNDKNIKCKIVTLRVTYIIVLYVYSIYIYIYIRNLYLESQIVLRKW